MDPIEAALRQRPSDEPPFEEPLDTVRLRDASTRRRRTVSVRSALAGIAAACLVGVLVLGGLALRGSLVGGGPTPPPSPAPTASPAGDGILISCWGGAPGFPPDRLEGPANAEAGTDAPAAALRAVLTEPSASGLPRTGYRAVYASPDAVEFLAGDAANGYVSVQVVRGGRGAAGPEDWSGAGWGYCTLRAVPPVGYGSATWQLDPTVRFSPDATELHILVEELACHGGSSTAADRIEDRVTYSSGEVRVLVYVRAFEGAATCPAPPPTPYVVHLGQPVGSRVLLDAGTWPATTIATARGAIPSP